MHDLVGSLLGKNSGPPVLIGLLANVNNAESRSNIQETSTSPT